MRPGVRLRASLPEQAELLVRGWDLFLRSARERRRQPGHPRRDPRRAHVRRDSVLGRVRGGSQRHRRHLAREREPGQLVVVARVPGGAERPQGGTFQRRLLQRRYVCQLAV